MATYSDKTVARISETKIEFTDGSVADLAEGIAYNRGKGEIRILRKSEITYEDYEPYGGMTDFCEELQGYRSLDITLSNNCTVSVLTAEEEAPRVCAKGSARFISGLNLLAEGDTLYVKVEKKDVGENNELFIYTPFSCGKELKCRIEGNATMETRLAFQRGELCISGCGAIKLGELGSLLVQIAGSGAVSTSNIKENADLRVSGSGDIHMGDIGGTLFARISGSGDVVAQNIGAAKTTVSGSGDICVATLQSSLTARIAGSGDIVCKKECTIESLALTVSGACTLSANGLTVQNADIRADGNADITLARIAGTSVEKLSKGCRLTVKERG